MERRALRTVAFVDPASSPGYISPMGTLIKRGLVKDRDPKTFFRDVIFAGSHDAALLALLSRNADAATSFGTPPEQFLKETVELIPQRNVPMKSVSGG